MTVRRAKAVEDALLGRNTPALVGSKLRHALRAAGISPNELADKMGVTCYVTESMLTGKGRIGDFAHAFALLGFTLEIELRPLP
jgi:hypothetical protein